MTACCLHHYTRLLSRSELSAALLLPPGTLPNIMTAADSLASFTSRPKTHLFNEIFRHYTALDNSCVLAYTYCVLLFQNTLSVFGAWFHGNLSNSVPHLVRTFSHLVRHGFSTPARMMGIIRVPMCVGHGTKMNIQSHSARICAQVLYFVFIWVEHCLLICAIPYISNCNLCGIVKVFRFILYS